LEEAIAEQKKANGLMRAILQKQAAQIEKICARLETNRAGARIADK